MSHSILEAGEVNTFSGGSCGERAISQEKKKIKNKIKSRVESLSLSLPPPPRELHFSNAIVLFGYSKVTFSTNHNIAEAAVLAVP